MTQRDDASDSNVPCFPWGELDELCKKIHDLFYVQNSPKRAREHIQALERILSEFPSLDEAILYWDARALLAELTGQHCEAIEHRLREIQLMRKLHQLVEDGTDSRYVLIDRDVDCLESRMEILRALQQDYRDE